MRMIDWILSEKVIITTHRQTTEDTEKVAIMQALLVDNFLKRLWTICKNNNFVAVFTHQCP